LSKAEEHLAFQLDAVGISYVREFVFAPPRKFRLDFFFSPDVACEIDGAIWTGGRHSRGAGVMADCEKYAMAAAKGIRVVRVTPQHVKDGRAIDWIHRAITFRRQSESEVSATDAEG
jgi:hypothetical protein